VTISFSGIKCRAQLIVERMAAVARVGIRSSSRENRWVLSARNSLQLVLVVISKQKPYFGHFTVHTRMGGF